MHTVNLVSVLLFVACSLYLLCQQSSAQPDGALTVVQQEAEGEASVETEEEEDISDQGTTYDPFHPTNEWQTVKEGQAIPAGLHVRMNFETGMREAKLAEGDSKFKYWRDGDREGMMNMDRKQFSMEELKRALKDFKTTQLEDTDLQREDEVKQKFRSYDELKKDFESMNMDIKTDAEIIEELLSQLKRPDTQRDNMLTILTDLEYYLHQIDNAILFKDLGGLPYLVKFLNKTDDEQLQIETAMVLGAAVSSNPKVQIGALESGALHLLLRLMSTQSSVKLRRKVLFATSSLCRHFPFAQKHFLALGGLTALGKIFEESGTDKLQVKALAFLNDMLTEKILTEKHSNPEKTSEGEKLRQYSEVKLKEVMIEKGWCDRLTHLLALPDHDSRETTLKTMTTLADACQEEFIKSKDQLKTLENEYLKLDREDEDDDGYFKHIAQIIRRLTDLVTKSKRHDSGEL